MAINGAARVSGNTPNNGGMLVASAASLSGITRSNKANETVMLGKYSVSKEKYEHLRGLIYSSDTLYNHIPFGLQELFDDTVKEKIKMILLFCNGNIDAAQVLIRRYESKRNDPEIDIVPDTLNEGDIQEVGRAYVSLTALVDMEISLHERISEVFNYLDQKSLRVKVNSINLTFIEDKKYIKDKNLSFRDIRFILFEQYSKIMTEEVESARSRKNYVSSEEIRDLYANMVLSGLYTDEELAAIDGDLGATIKPGDPPRQINTRNLIIYGRRGLFDLYKADLKRRQSVAGDRGNIVSKYDSYLEAQKRYLSDDQFAAFSGELADVRAAVYQYENTDAVTTRCEAIKRSVKGGIKQHALQVYIDGIIGLTDDTVKYFSAERFKSFENGDETIMFWMNSYDGVGRLTKKQYRYDRIKYDADAKKWTLRLPSSYEKRLRPASNYD